MPLTEELPEGKNIRADPRDWIGTRYLSGFHHRTQFAGQARVPWLTASSAWNTSVGALLAALLFVGCNASSADGGTAEAQGGPPLLRLHGDIPPEMGLRFELTFEATTDARDCKKRSLADGELYPIEERRQFHHNPEGTTYETNVLLGWGEASKCKYEIYQVKTSFTHDTIRDTGGWTSIFFNPDIDFKNRRAPSRLNSSIEVFCQRDSNNPVRVSHALECDDRKVLNDNRSVLSDYYVNEVPADDTLALRLNMTLEEAIQRR